MALAEKFHRKAVVKLSYWNTDGKCISANDSYLKCFSESFQTAALPKEVVPGQPVATEYLRQAMQDATVTLCLPIEFNQKHYRLTYIPDVEDGIVAGCIVQLDEISEFKQRELEHNASEARFRTIIENAPDALIISNAEGKIEMMNSRSEHLFGYTSQELIGKPVEMLMPERFRKGHPTKRQGFVDNKHSRAMGDLILAGLRKDGSEFPTDVSLSPMHTPDGLLITAAFRDITQKVERENEIKKYHEQLQKQSSQIENILGSISESFCLLDASWQIRYWNAAAERTTGKNREEVMDKFMWDVFPQRAGSTLYDNCHEVMQTRKATSFEHYSAEGTWFYNSVYPNNDGGLTIYFKDITGRKKAENEVLAIKNNQYALINATKDLMWSVDREYKLISANKGYDDFIEKLLGYKHLPGDFVLIDQTTGHYFDHWQTFLDRSLNGESFFIEIEEMPDYLTQFNPIIDAPSNKITGVACHSTNISERTRLEKEKHDSAERFRAVVQNGSDLIFILDASHGLNYMSPSAANLLGGDALLIGASLLDFVHPESVEEVLSGIKKTATQRTVKLNDIKIKDANGNWLWLESTIDNLLDNSAVQGLVVNARDITEHKRRDAERERLINELTRSNSDLMQFSFITSHNLRAPLSNIKGLLDFVDKTSLNEELGSVIEMIEISTQKLTETISDLSQLLIIRNTTEIPTKNLDIEQVFHRVNRNFLEAENDIEATISIELAEAMVNFNESYLESIFINLISNAIKYRCPDRTLKISLESKKSEKGICLTFSDNGKGIDIERHGLRLFGMYQRFHANTEGQGLGLFIIKAQINALGGSVEVESKVDNGTAFHIFFPR